MKITIDISPEDCGGLREMADYLGCDLSQLVSALLTGQAEDYNRLKSDGIWQIIIDELRLRYGNTDRMDRVERYLDACFENAQISEQGQRSLIFNHLESLETWESFIAGRN